jgi:nickel/cobalt exporter
MQADVTLSVLLSTALSVAALHTLIGVDHSLPFIALARARDWSLRRTLAITAACGVGHVLSSVVLGALGIGLGVAVERLEWVEAGRGTLASWMLIAFGLVYAAYGAVRASRGRAHAHAHVHETGQVHAHHHDHRSVEHLHPHAAPSAGATAVWTLFIIFAFGPCEPLIPLLMAPAALQHWSWVVLVVLVFGVVTIGMMLAVVTLGYVGVARLRFGFAERHASTLAGLAIACSGVMIQAFGL